MLFCVDSLPLGGGEVAVFDELPGHILLTLRGKVGVGGQGVDRGRVGDARHQGGFIGGHGGGFLAKVAGAGGVEHQLKIKRGGETFDVTVTPVKLGVYGVGVQLGMLEYPSPFRQFAYVWEMSFRSLRNISISLAKKLNLTEQQSTVSARNLSGPLGIVSMMYKTAHYSLITGIYFVVFVSFALAIFNLLPLPVLDGGHIFFAAIELIFRHPVPKWLVKNLSLIFIVLLFSAMALLTMLDVMRLVPPEEVELKEPVIVSIDNPEPPADAAEGSETEAQK